MVKMLAPELAMFKIRINCVCPGGTQTNIRQTNNPHDLENIRIRIEYRFIIFLSHLIYLSFYLTICIYPDGTIPLTGKTLLDPTVVAQAILYFSQATYVTGSELYVDGGQSTLA